MSRHAHKHGAYSITPLPGQPQVCVTHGFFVLPDSRGKGHGHALKELQVARIKRNHYDCAICTVLSSNAKQKKVLEKSGYRHLISFNNSSTGADTEVWGRAFNEEQGE